MRQVINGYKKNSTEKRLMVLKLEIDYQLTTLHDAMVEEDQTQIKRSKDILEKYRKELLSLEE